MTGLPRTVGTIGAGNMAEAILRGLLRAGMAPDALHAADPDAGRRQRMSELGVRVTADNLELVRISELVVLAVKPQQLEAAAATLEHAGGPLYLSIVAGATTAVLRRLLGVDARIVRSMPNTPALIGAGITAVASDTGGESADLERACSASVGDGDFLLVEGAGGLLSPLARDGLVADLAARLRLPVLLVVADRLGCLNHALLSAEALAARGLTLAAVVLNRVDAAVPAVAHGIVPTATLARPCAAEMDNAADLARWLAQPVVCVPHSRQGEAPWMELMPHLAALAQKLHIPR